MTSRLSRPEVVLAVLTSDENLINSDRLREAGKASFPSRRLSSVDPPVKMANYKDQSDVIVTLTARDSGPAFIVPERRITLTPQKSSARIGRASKVPSKGCLAKKDNAWFESPVMSRYHAELAADFDAKTIRITDIGSLHGTFHTNKNAKDTQDEVKLATQQPVELADGDELRFGTDIFRTDESFPPCIVGVQLKWNLPTALAAPCKTPAPTNTFAVPDDDDDDEDEDFNMDNTNLQETIDLTQDEPALPQLVASSATAARTQLRGLSSDDAIDLTSDEFDMPGQSVHGFSSSPEPAELKVIDDGQSVRGFSSSPEPAEPKVIDDGEPGRSQHRTSSSASRSSSSASRLSTPIPRSTVEMQFTQTERVSPSVSPPPSYVSEGPYQELAIMASMIDDTSDDEVDAHDDDDEIHGNVSGDDYVFDSEMDAQMSETSDISDSDMIDDYPTEDMDSDREAELQVPRYFYEDMSLSDTSSEEDDESEADVFEQPPPAPASPTTPPTDVVPIREDTEPLLLSTKPNTVPVFSPLATTVDMPNSLPANSAPVMNRQPSPSDAALFKSSHQPLDTPAPSKSAAETLGEKFGKMEYFAARDHNRTAAIRRAQSPDFSVSVSAIRETLSVDKSVDDAKDNKAGPVITPYQPHHPWSRDPLPILSTAWPTGSEWTASGESFINNPLYLDVLPLPTERTRLQSPELDMTSAYTFQQSKMTASVNASRNMRRLPIKDLLAQDSKEASPAAASKPVPAVDGAVSSLARSNVNTSRPKRSFAEVFDGEEMDSSSPQLCKVSPPRVPAPQVVCPRPTVQSFRVDGKRSLHISYKEPVQTSVDKENMPPETVGQEPTAPVAPSAPVESSKRFRDSLLGGIGRVCDQETTENAARAFGCDLSVVAPAEPAITAPTAQSSIRPVKRRRVGFAQVARYAFTTVLGGAVMFYGMVSTAPEL